jgi:uncharacterized OB-fold protein
MTTCTPAAAIPPIRPGLFETDPPRLLGTRCGDCGCVSFPARDFCPRCHADGPHPRVPLSRQGRIFSYTVVRQAPAGWKTPYVLAYVDLPEEVRVLAQVHAAPDQVRLGQAVHLVLHEMVDASGEPRLNFAFEAGDAREVCA